VPYYETVVVVDPTTQEGTDEKHLTAIKDLISAQSGSVLKTEHWGKRKLAYAIRHKREGIYFLVEYDAAGDAVGKVEQYCRLQESILRYLTISREAPSSEGELSPIAKEASTDDSEPREAPEQAEAMASVETPADELLVAEAQIPDESEDVAEEVTEEPESTEAPKDESPSLLDEGPEPLLEETAEKDSEEERKE
jgi:small subunit ribosomal protein S6